MSKIYSPTAKALAKVYHDGQKYGKPNPTEDYFTAHIEKVAQRVKDAGLSDKYVAVAYLHDIVEDTEMTLEELDDLGFSEEIVAGVDGMTRREGEMYAAFIHRAMQNPISHQVKIHDVSANLAACAENEPLRSRYEKALKILKV